MSERRRFLLILLLLSLVAGCQQMSRATTVPLATLTSGDVTPLPAQATTAARTPPVAVTQETPTTVATALPPTTMATSTATLVVATPLAMDVPKYTFEVVAALPHDPQAFTQGLVIDDDRWFEGTGQYGHSSLREVDPTTGEVLRHYDLPNVYFGEGITVLGDNLYQLTWREGVGFIYDKDTFELLRVFEYPHEGWGLTHDGQTLIVSDGTSTIRLWDSTSLEEVGQISVHDADGPVANLNELEYVNGEIWANIWQTDTIARITPGTGEVVGYINLTGLLDRSTLSEPVDVLNGIAYDAATDRLFVTGKLWPSIYEIRVVPATEHSE